MYILYKYIRIKPYRLFEKQEMSQSFEVCTREWFCRRSRMLRKYCFEDAWHTYIHMVFGKCKCVITRLPDKHQLVKSCDTRWWDTGRMIGHTCGVCMQRRSRRRDRWTCSPPVSVTWCTKDNLIHKSWYAKRVRRECISRVGLKSTTTTSRMAPL